MSHESVPNTPQPKQEGSEIDQAVVPSFVKEFSRKNSAEERIGLAEKIRAERSEYFEKRREQESLTQILEAQGKELDDYNSGSFLTKVQDYFRMRKAKEALGITQIQKTEADVAIASSDPNKSGQEAIDSFYESEKNKWANAEWNKEDIVKLFTEEHLASLSIEEYALLMKRFPSEMVTHVTRQGIRDHTGMWEHSAGEGAFHNGFERIIEDGNLRSPLAVKFIEDQKEGVILKCLNQPKTRGEALSKLKNFLESGYGAYTDRAAIHFAAEEVADHYYGSEKGNEIFLAYPSAFIGSQYHFSHGNISPDPERLSDTKHNDAWVLTQEERGIKLDAALVFLPQDAKVDPKNGSRYEIGTDNNPIKNEAAYEGLERFANSPEFGPIAKKIMEKTGGLHWELPSPSTWESELMKTQGWQTERKDVLETLLSLRDQIKEISGITDDCILERLVDYNNLSSLESANVRKEELDRNRDMDFKIDGILEQSGARFIEAQNTISSEEYWNHYFAAHPDKKPSKIVFYSGGNPTKAMWNWKRKHGLSKMSDDRSAGFKEHVAMNVAEQISSIQERTTRFESLAHAVIDDHFPESVWNEQREIINKGKEMVRGDDYDSPLLNDLFNQLVDKGGQMLDTNEIDPDKIYEMKKIIDTIESSTGHEMHEPPVN